MYVCMYVCSKESCFVFMCVCVYDNDFLYMIYILFISLRSIYALLRDTGCLYRRKEEKKERKKRKQDCFHPCV